MDSKQRVDAALRHRQGRIPLDIGGTGVSGVHVSIVEKLREYYGLEKRPVKLWRDMMMLGEIEDDLRGAMKIDTKPFPTLNTSFGCKYEDFKEWRAPWGQLLLVPGRFNPTEDDRYVYMYPQGDACCAPSAKMPKSGFFFDPVNRQGELDEDELRVEDNLAEYGETGDGALAFYRQGAGFARQGEHAVIGAFGGTGLGDVGAINGIALKEPKGVRDVEEWYVTVASRQGFVKELFERQTDIALGNLKKIWEAVGDSIPFILSCGTDFGMQSGLLCSKSAFSELYLPYYKKVNHWIHQNTSWKIAKHSCGSIAAIIPLLIEAEFDILNPVQWTAKGMDMRMLKREFGRDLVFWGGGADTQHTLPYGKPEEVREQVLKTCEVFGEGGGFIFNAVHNIQALTPVENIVAMVDALHEFNA